MDKNTDLRVVKTRANIQKTFIDLLSEKDFDQITIQNILDRALINRSTFYRHYSDKYDLAEVLINEIVGNASSYISERFNDAKENDLMTTLYNIYKYLHKQNKPILALLKINTSTLNLNDDIQILLKDNFTQYLIKYNACEDSSLLDYYSTLYASLVITTVKWFFTSGNESDIMKIIQHFRDTLSNTILFIN